MRDVSREELLQLTPDKYLAEGYFSEAGAPRPELRDEFALAAATQFMQAELSPQELGLTLEGIRQVLPLHEEADAYDRLYAALQEATELVARMIRQPNNEVLRQWLYDCAAAVADEKDIGAFLDHVAAVNRRYGVMAALLESDAPETPPPTVH